jgi:hypothetical protein
VNSTVGGTIHRLAGKFTVGGTRDRFKINALILKAALSLAFFASRKEKSFALTFLEATANGK